MFVVGTPRRVRSNLKPWVILHTGLEDTTHAIMKIVPKCVRQSVDCVVGNSFEHALHIGIPISECSQ